MKTNALSVTEADVHRWLEEVPDPEIPVISVVDLGVVREVELISNEEIKVTITPTYTGCPAIDVMNLQIRKALVGRGFKKVQVDYRLSPAWTSDWIPEAALQKMKAFGVAPPRGRSTDKRGLFEEIEVPCPYCDAHHTELVSEFASTACKALYRCLECKEPFEYFKCH